MKKWNIEPEQARRREREIRRHFPEAWVEGFEPLMEVMTNEPHDRHVLAAAVRSDCQLITTYNRRHFPAAAIKHWQIEIEAPSRFLRGLYDLAPGLFVHKLHEQAQAIGIKLERLLQSLWKNARGLVEYFCEEQSTTFHSACNSEI